MQPHEHAEGGFCAGVQGGLGQADSERRSILVPALDHRSGRGGDGDVGGGPAGLGSAGAERGDGDMDQAGVDCRQCVVAEAKRVHRADVGRLDERVGAACELDELRLAFVGLQIQDDRSLAPCVGLPDEGVFDLAVVGAVGERASSSGGVAVGWLDCDHICAEVGEDHAADQAAVVGQVENSVVAEHGEPLACSPVCRPVWRIVTMQKGSWNLGSPSRSEKGRRLVGHAGLGSLERSPQVAGALLQVLLHAVGCSLMERSADVDLGHAQLDGAQ